MRALKPVVSGFTPEAAEDSDCGLILRSLDRAVTPQAIDEISPWRFAAPLSPDMAAAREGRKIEFNVLVEFCQSASKDARRNDDILLIEGIGGVMVPLTEAKTTLDLMAVLSLPAILVVGSYLGSLSHALTAAEALTARDVAIAGIVISESADGAVPVANTAATLGRFVTAGTIIAVPRLPDDAGAWRAAPDLTGLVTPKAQ